MKTMERYNNMYSKCDVLLQANAFEKFRNRCFKNCNLCLSNYLRAMLSMTKVELDLISDIDMYFFFLFLKKEYKTGSVSYISKKYSTPNNKYLASHDPKKPTKYITYLNNYVL